MSSAVHDALEALPPETAFGFWVYITTDCMIFASLFATFFVQHAAYAGGPTGVPSLIYT